MMLAAGMVLGVQAQELKVKVDVKGKLGYVDVNGKEVIPCKFETASPFKNGLAIVGKGSKFGMIDTTGKWVVPMKYKNISVWNDNMYKISIGKFYGLANLKGEIVIEPEYTHISSPNCYGKALIAKGGSQTTGTDKKTYIFNAKLGIIDANGKFLIQPIEKGLYEFTYNGASTPAMYEGKGMKAKSYSLKDTLVTDCKYVGLGKTCTSDLNAGLYNENGQELIKQGEYAYLMYPSNGMVRYYKANKQGFSCGYYNLDTNKANEVSSYTTPLKDFSKWTHGDFIGNIAPVNGETWKFIDRDGNVMRSGYSNISHNKNLGLWTAINAEGKCEVFDENGNDQKSLCGYENMLLPQTKENRMLFSAKKDGKWGVIDAEGKTVVPFKYEGATYPFNNMIGVKQNDRWGIIDSNDKLIMPIKFIDFYFATDKESKDVWVKTDSIYFQHYNLSTKKLSPQRFKKAYHFYKSMALGVPDSLTVENTPINRAQMFAAGSDVKTVATADVSKSEIPFGYLINSNGEYVMKYPISALYYTKVIEAIAALEEKPTENDIKAILLNITKENRTYPLNSILSEEEWDF